MAVGSGSARTATLYAAVGDNANRTNAQTASNLFGKIVRIDVHGDAFPADPTRNYAIPPTTCSSASMGAAPEIFALGLRNPFRDSLIAAPASSSHRRCRRAAGRRSISGAAAPITGGRGGGRAPATAARLGPERRRRRLLFPTAIRPASAAGDRRLRLSWTSAALQGQYFFADLGSGHGSYAAQHRRRLGKDRLTAQIHTNIGTIVTPTSFGEDARGNLYIVTQGGDVSG